MYFRYLPLLRKVDNCSCHGSAEVGCRPLLIDIIRKSKLYIEHHETNKGLLANSALLFEQSINDECNSYQLVRNIAPNDVNTNDGNTNLTKIQPESFRKPITSVSIWSPNHKPG